MLDLAETPSWGACASSMRGAVQLAARIAAAIGLLACLSSEVRAEEPSGCDAFKWSLKHEADLLQAVNKPAVASGGTAKPDGSAYAVGLVALSDAHLPQAPGRTPKSNPSNAGFLQFAAPSTAGTIQVTLSDAAWVDVLQDGKSVKASAFSGARDCPGVRKSLRFPLVASPFVVQISGTGVTSIGIVAAAAPK